MEGRGVAKGRTYDRHPVHEMCIMRIFVDEVCCDTHDYDGGDPVQYMGCEEERTVHLVRTGGSRSAVVRCGGIPMSSSRSAIVICRVSTSPPGFEHVFCGV